MSKLILLSMLLVLTYGCGKKSVIKNDVLPQTTAEAYGDGKHLVRPLVVPLTDEVIESFDSPLSKIGFVAGGFAKLFMNLGAGLGLGKRQLSLIQHVPEIPTDIIKATNIKRVFFYIEPKPGSNRWKSFLQRWFFGRSNVEFRFIEKIVVTLRPHHVENVASWTPLFEVKEIGNREFSPFQRHFEQREQLFNETAQRAWADQQVLLLYERENTAIKNDTTSIYIIDTEEPAKTRVFLEEHPRLSGFFTRVHILNKSILVELKNDPIIHETFQFTLSEEAPELEKLGVTFIDQCTVSTCFDIKIPEVNVVPTLVKDNAIKLDAFIDADKVPDDFQLKGFIELEVKMKLTF